MGALSGLVALVTGGGRGLGLGFAQHLGEQGAVVALMGRDEATLARAVDELSRAGVVASSHQGNVVLPEEVDGVVEEVVGRHGRLDIVVNNAGVADEASFLDITLEGWSAVIAVNLTGPFLVTQRAALRMDAGGSVVNIASIDAHGADGPYASYVAAKAGLIGLTKAAAAELAHKNIRVNCVSPGWVLTQMAADAVRPEMLDQMRAALPRAPLGRMVTTEEVAAAVTFLASPAAAGITGTELVVDGGTLANLYILESVAIGTGPGTP